MLEPKQFILVDDVLINARQADYIIKSERDNEYKICVRGIRLYSQCTKYNSKKDMDDAWIKILLSLNHFKIPTK
jgi:hypothetical protein